MTRLYGRALKGERVRGEKPLNRGNNVSNISALSLQEVVVTRNIHGSVDAVTFEAFIMVDVVPKLKPNSVIMDHAKIQGIEMVRSAIEETGAKLIYLSPYSPEFSPIEQGQK